MQNMRKIVSGLMAAVLAFAVLASPVLAADKVSHPKDPQGILMDFSLLGAKVGRASSTTTVTLVSAGAGLLFGLCSYGTSAVAGSYSEAFDTGAAGSVDFTYESLAISPIVYSFLATSAAIQGEGNLGCWKPSVPIRFERGLVLKNSAATSSAIAFYRLFSAVNP